MTNEEINATIAKIKGLPEFDVTRCPVCGWKYEVTAAQGCRPGNCSLRPAPPPKFWWSHRNILDWAGDWNAAMLLVKEILDADNERYTVEISFTHRLIRVTINDWRPDGHEEYFKNIVDAASEKAVAIETICFAYIKWVEKTHGA